MNLSMVLVLVGQLTVTSYRSVKDQTDSTPFHTSTNERVQPGGVAVSRDLLCGACRKLHKRCRHPEYVKKLHYGDWLYVETYGFRFINDCMGETKLVKTKTKRYRKVIKNQIDIWVKTYKEERSVQVKKLNVYKVREEIWQQNPKRDLFVGKKHAK